MAGLFKKALEENFSGAFEQVIFAITDWSEDDRFIGPFVRAFALYGQKKLAALSYLQLLD